MYVPSESQYPRNESRRKCSARRELHADRNGIIHLQFAHITRYVPKCHWNVPSPIRVRVAMLAMLCSCECIASTHNSPISTNDNRTASIHRRDWKHYWNIQIVRFIAAEAFECQVNGEKVSVSTSKMYTPLPPCSSTYGQRAAIGAKSSTHQSARGMKPDCVPIFDPKNCL